MREPREFMREILDKNPPRVGRQIHKDGTYEKVKISKRKVQKWIPNDPRNERTCAHMWRKVGSGGP